MTHAEKSTQCVYFCSSTNIETFSQLMLSPAFCLHQMVWTWKMCRWSFGEVKLPTLHKGRHNLTTNFSVSFGGFISISQQCCRNSRNTHSNGYFCFLYQEEPFFPMRRHCFRWKSIGFRIYESAFPAAPKQLALNLWYICVCARVFVWQRNKLFISILNDNFSSFSLISSAHFISNIWWCTLYSVHNVQPTMRRK